MDDNFECCFVNDNYDLCVADCDGCRYHPKNIKKANRVKIASEYKNLKCFWVGKMNTPEKKKLLAFCKSSC
jgi:hypothetical protein